MLGDDHTPANSAPRHRNEKPKMLSKARQKSLLEYTSQFFGKVNIEVIRGHQRSILATFRISAELFYNLRNRFR